MFYSIFAFIPFWIVIANVIWRIEFIFLLNLFVLSYSRIINTKINNLEKDKNFVEYYFEEIYRLQLNSQ